MHLAYSLLANDLLVDMADHFGREEYIRLAIYPLADTVDHHHLAQVVVPTEHSHAAMCHCQDMVDLVRVGREQVGQGRVVLEQVPVLAQVSVRPSVPVLAPLPCRWRSTKPHPSRCRCA